MVNAFVINDKLVNKYKMKENFINFDNKKYVGLYKDLNYIKTKSEAWKHWINHGKRENRSWCSLPKIKAKLENKNETYENFNFLKYIAIYDDLKKKFNTKSSAWYHWTKFGKNEERVWCGIKNLCTENYISKSFFEENYTIYISRHITNNINKKYWLYNYNQLRKFYKKINIVIIDDNSHPEFLHDDKSYNDIEFIYSEYKKRGELLPYYYYYKYPKTKYAMVIHDSFFLHYEIHKIIKENDYTPLWTFKSYVYFKNLESNIKLIINELNNNDEINNCFENRMMWFGNFGAMSIISHKRISDINNKFNFFDILVKEIYTRERRMSLERILPICNILMNSDEYIEPLFGDIHDWCKEHLNSSWGDKMTLSNYVKNINCKNNCIAVKLWTGR